MNIIPIPAKPEDLPALMKLHQLLRIDTLEGVTPFTWATKQWITSNLEDFTVLKDESRLIGAICASEATNNTVQLETLVIATEYRGQGYGRKLVGHAARVARSFQKTRMLVETYAAYDTLGFYEKCGFNFRGTYHDKGTELPFHLLEMDLRHPQ